MKIKVHNIGGYVVKNYLLATPIGIIAIDTGYAGGLVKFKRRFEKRWPLSALKYIFLTHHHDDHAGFLGELLKITNAKVILHPSAIQHLVAGRSNQPPGAGYSSRPAWLFSKIKEDFSFPPVHIGDSAIHVQDENDQIFINMRIPLQIVFLPGHTADSIGLFMPENGKLFCGDAAMNAIISVARHTIWIEDAAESFMG